jgi:hypothetical protein
VVARAGVQIDEPEMAARVVRVRGDALLDPLDLLCRRGVRLARVNA